MFLSFFIPLFIFQLQSKPQMDVGHPMPAVLLSHIEGQFKVA